jgi:hypothetical protein
MYCGGGIVANVVLLPGKISCNSSTESVGRVWSQEAASYKALRSPTGFNINIKRANTYHTELPLSSGEELDALVPLISFIRGACNVSSQPVSREQ